MQRTLTGPEIQAFAEGLLTLDPGSLVTMLELTAATYLGQVQATSALAGGVHSHGQLSVMMTTRPSVRATLQGLADMMND